MNHTMRNTSLFFLSYKKEKKCDEWELRNHLDKEFSPGALQIDFSKVVTPETICVVLGDRKGMYICEGWGESGFY